MRQIDPRLAALLAFQPRRAMFGGEEARFEPPAPVSAPVPAEAPPEAAQPEARPERAVPPGPPRPGRRWRVFDRVLGGDTLTEAREREDAREAAGMRAAEIEALAQGLEMSDEERLLFRTDPEQWAKLALSRNELRTVSAGSLVGDGSGPLWGAPTMRMDGGVPVEQDPMTGQTTYGDPRPLGPNETVRADIDRARLAEIVRHNQAAEGQAAAREGRISGARGSTARRAPPGPPTRRAQESPAMAEARRRGLIR